MTNNKKLKPNSKHTEWATKIRSALGKISTFHFTDEIAQHLAAFEAEVTGWRTDFENAEENTLYLVQRRDGELVLATISKRVGLDQRLRVSGKCSLDFGDASCCFFFPINGDQSSDDAPIAWREITLPAQPEKEGE